MKKITSSFLSPYVANNMRGNIIGFIVSIIALASATLFSYTYFEQKFGPAGGPTATTTIQKATTTAKTAPAPVIKAPTAQKAPAVKTPTKANGSLTPVATAIKKEVVVPGPLRVSVAGPAPAAVPLTTAGVVEYTNRARAENGGLAALVRNSTLDRNAQMKLDDMFANQYFEHVSPVTGAGPADLAKAVGYAYVTVGENLALGDFGSDAVLVEAWMNSPGHRANILNTHYQEIGVAVSKGMYEGRQTWLAVQSFGTPLSACPAIDATKKAQIELNNAEISRMRAEIDAKKARIDSTSPYDPNYNTYVNEFNVLIPPYNALVEANRALVAEYNTTVQAFNSCIAVAGVH